MFEMVEDLNDDPLRVVYTLRFNEVVYVLHTFQKKSQNGIKIAQTVVDLVNTPLKLAQKDRRGMASRSEETTVVDDEAITRGGRNDFADLSSADAEECQTKLRPAHTINGLIARRRFNQVTAAERLGITQPKVSALANCKRERFSVERLITLLTALDQDVDIEIRNKPSSRAVGQIAVVAAAAAAAGGGGA